MLNAISTFFYDLTSLNNAIVGYIPSLIALWASTMGVAAWIAKRLPPPDGPGVFAKFHKLINWLGQNSGYAENKN